MHMDTHLELDKVSCPRFYSELFNGLRQVKYKCQERENKQVTRGYNIVAEGWAGASNPHPHPKSIANPHTHKHLERLFSTF